MTQKIRPLREPSAPARPAASLERERHLKPSLSHCPCERDWSRKAALWRIQSEMVSYRFPLRTHTTRFLWSCQTYSCTIGLSSPCPPTPTRTLTRHVTQHARDWKCYTKTISLKQTVVDQCNHYLFHCCNKQHGQYDEMQQGHEHMQVRHFHLPLPKRSKQ